MVSNVMSLPWKLTSQKNNFKILLIILSGILISVLVILFSNSSCGVQHMVILNEINSYEETLDPEFCEVIVEKIDLFNDSCEPQIEILDCG
ncbi:hypothetical protein AAA799E16_00711 [Marine Group I thaumarchaeote SCGC AAA799-E16]|nr:hypothetical protein AAA799E16_00711 [Marine Group I thaumarchaeote SCGC AAA799-E16]KFM16439.1 hypothetical protein AAA799D11_00652 [Marine Group I thaumarchaeote SCGC AAA799-D11]KFM18405.1 hypothetical protein SCCGRSA3_01091 [Marine Group I thaumarchaeote SCGC RSA3]